MSVDESQDVDRVFLSPIKVNISSISAVSMCSGMGGLGKSVACALTIGTLYDDECQDDERILRMLMPSTYICTARSRISFR